MKRTVFNLFILTFVLLFGVTACKKKPINTTNIPGMSSGFKAGGTGGPENGGVPNPPENNPPGNDIGIDQAGRGGIEGRDQNRSKFAANTVYFDLDSAAVKANEKSKIEEVANYFKGSAVGDLLIEGHCDERGTEGYNGSLGDKRANSLREYLVNLGVSSGRVHVLSLGEAKPAVDGHDEAAWSKNRRGEFVFIEPAK